MANNTQGLRSVLRCESYSISECKKFFALVDCVHPVFQGESATVNIQLADSDREKLDLDIFSEIYLLAFDERDQTVATYRWPTSTTDLPIIILQHLESHGIVDEGLFSIDFTGQMTENYLSGRIFVEIRLTRVPYTENDVPGTDLVDVISCLHVVTIKPSRIVRYNQELEDNET